MSSNAGAMNRNYVGNFPRDMTRTIRGWTFPTRTKLTMPRNDELLTRKRSQSETDKPRCIQIWSKFPSTCADFSGGSWGIQARVTAIVTQLPKHGSERDHDTCSSPADCLVHHVAGKHAYQAADNATVSRKIVVHTLFAGCHSLLGRTSEDPRMVTRRNSGIM